MNGYIIEIAQKREEVIRWRFNTFFFSSDVVRSMYVPSVFDFVCMFVSLRSDKVNQLVYVPIISPEFRLSYKVGRQV